MRRWLAPALFGLLAAVATGLLTAPAGLIDSALDSATLGRVRLAEAQGTLWNGSGRLVLTAGSGRSDQHQDTSRSEANAGDNEPEARRTRADELAAVLAGVALPGRLSWILRPWPLLVGLIDASVDLDGMPEPVRLQGGFDELRIGPGRLALPSVELGGLGSPWNSIKPSGALALQWEPLVVRDGLLQGNASIELSNASSALTPVNPLGSYRVDVVGKGQEATLAMHTLSGPLRLSGTGIWTARAGLRFDAEAQAAPDQAERLRSFLGVIGRVDGGRTIIRIGA